MTKALAGCHSRMAFLPLAGQLLPTGMVETWTLTVLRHRQPAGVLDRQVRSPGLPRVQRDHRSDQGAAIGPCSPTAWPNPIRAPDTSRRVPGSARGRAPAEPAARRTGGRPPASGELAARPAYRAGYHGLDAPGWVALRARRRGGRQARGGELGSVRDKNKVAVCRREAMSGSPAMIKTLGGAGPRRCGPRSCPSGWPRWCGRGRRRCPGRR